MYDYNVFISFYGADSRSYAKALAKELEQKDLRVYFDENDSEFPKQKDATKYLLEKIEKSENIILIWSKNYATSYYTSLEKAKIISHESVFVIVCKDSEEEFKKEFPSYIYKKEVDIDNSVNSFLDFRNDSYRKYKNELISEYKEKKLLNTNSTLQDVYVDQSFSIYEPCIKEKNNFTYLNSLDKELFLEHKYKHIFEYLESLFNEEEDEIYETNLFILLGQPGSGKSSLTKKLLCEAKTSKEIVLIQLRNFYDIVENTTTPIIRDYAIENFLKHKGYTKNLEKKIIILDGLDEFIMLAGSDIENINSFVENSFKLLLNFVANKNNKILITTRFGYIDFKTIESFLNSNREDLRKIIVLKLEPFSKKQIFSMLNRLDAISKQKNAIKNILEDTKDSVNELLSQPIILFYIVSLNIEILGVKNRSDFYGKIFDKVIERKWEDDEFLSYLPDSFTLNSYKNMLIKIGSYLEFNSKLSLNKDELIGLIKEFEIKKKHYKTIFSDILVGFYFKERINQDNTLALEFLHRSFQEYFAALYLVKNFQFKDSYLKDFSSVIFSSQVKKFIYENIGDIDISKDDTKLLQKNIFKTKNIEKKLNKTYNVFWFFKSLFPNKQLFSDKEFKYFEYFNFLNTRVNNSSVTSSEMIDEAGFWFHYHYEVIEECDIVNIYKDIYFKEIKFLNNFISGKFIECKFEKCNFINLNTTELTFKNCVFENVIFKEANINSSFFQSCEFFGCSFENNSLFETVFFMCQFQNTNFDIENSFEKVDMNDCDGEIFILEPDGIEFINCDNLIIKKDIDE